VTDFAAALVIPQWQGAGRRIGYLAGTDCLLDLLPASLPRHLVDCPDSDDATRPDGVKSLALLAGIAGRAVASRQQIAGPVLTIGGDCAADLANAAAANATDDAALIWIDGHADLNTPASSPSGHFHGMVARCLMGEGPASLSRYVTRPYRVDQLFYVAVRDCDPAEAAHIAEMKIATTPVGSSPETLIAAIKAAGFSRLHLHLDLDSLDPAIFPYVGVPAAHGLDVDQLCQLLSRLCASFTIAGASITECNLADQAEADLARPILRRILQDGFGLSR
jgi:arginase